MAVILHGGDNAFRALAYQPPHPNISAYVQQHNATWQNRVSTEMNNFLQAAGNMYERVSHSEAMQMVRAVGRHVENMWRPDSVQYLGTIAQLQTAQPTMQRWAMACPEVLTAYRAQQCDGYSDEWVDQFPRVAPMDRHDYHVAVNGIFMEQPDGSHAAVCYLGEPDHESENLTHAQQTDILDTWDALRHHMQQRKEDPTSRFNAML